MTTLLLDVGNTRLKWAWLEQGIAQSAGAQAHSGQQLDVMFDKLFAAESVSAVVVSNVRGKSVEKSISDWFLRKKQLIVRFVYSTESFRGLKNAYNTPEQLGVDRWLAVIAAIHKYSGAICVLDCGTAVTLDIARGDGQHLGGLILPGLNMMRTSLSVNTSGAQWQAEDSEEKGCLGLDTQSAIALGTVAAIAGVTERTAHKFEQVYEQSLKVILTGGDATVIADKLRMACVVEPHLVLEGLAIVAQQKA